jgi:ubiquinone/menaquinone biosynthesis C-methylase UbiE
MKTNWDYTNLAEAYLARPQYSEICIKAMLDIAGVGNDSIACDIGAGVAHLTTHLAKYVEHVSAIEPNDEMRRIGSGVTKNFINVKWEEGTGEKTNQDSKIFDIVTFGSSFNVCDRKSALNETARILKPNGWFACLWNHRDLQNNIQASIEKIILNHVPNYSYGSRRENQEPIIKNSGLFSEVIHLSSEIVHSQTITDCIEAWKSHATLERQSGKNFGQIIYEIEKYLKDYGQLNSTNQIPIPYRTNIWMAQVA